MKKRMLLMLVVMTAIIAALGYFKFWQIQEAVAEAASYQPPPEAVTTIVAQREKWSATLSAIGTVAPVQGVTVSADLPGIVARIAFESGESVKAGDVLVELDTQQEQSQLAAAEADRDLARLNFERMKTLVAKGAIARASYDQAAAEKKRTAAGVEEIRATIARKTIRAPFSGVLGIRQVNLGQYLSGGSPVVPLQSLNPIYVNFDVPQQDARHVRPGRTMRVTSEDLAGAGYSGRITAINSVVDEDTRNVRIQATLSNPRGRLRPGMFVEVKVPIGASRSVIVVPASAINYAPYGDSVFVVSDLEGENGRTYKGVHQKFVKLGSTRGDQVAVLSGLEPDEEVVTSGTFKLRNGVAVLVNNSVQPSNQRTPTPEDN